jgi:hypothetical protein
VVQAAALMYGLYLVIDAMLLLVAWPICAPSERCLLREFAVYTPLLPLYRMMVYFFRLSGILRTLSEQPQWTTSSGWIEKVQMPGASHLKGWWGFFIQAWAD